MQSKLIQTCFLILLMALPLGTYSQKPARFMLQFQAGPSINYRMVARSDLAGIAGNDNLPRFSLRGGVSVRYSVTDRFSLESGLQWAPRGFTVRLARVFNEDRGQWPTHIYSHVRYQYAELPVRMSYCVLNEDIKLNVFAGASLSWLAIADFKTVSRFEGGHAIMEVDNVSAFTRPVTVFGLAGVSVDMPLKNGGLVQVSSFCDFSLMRPEIEFTNFTMLSSGITVGYLLPLRKGAFAPVQH